MIEIQVIGRDGSKKTVSAAPGSNLMEVLRDNDFDELMALCGGCCSCATCHVYIESGPEGSDKAGSADEDDLLESSEHRRPNSRLSCQMALSAKVADLVVRIAPED